MWLRRLADDTRVLAAIDDSALWFPPGFKTESSLDEIPPELSLYMYY